MPHPATIPTGLRLTAGLARLPLMLTLPLLLALAVACGGGDGSGGNAGAPPPNTPASPAATTALVIAAPTAADGSGADAGADADAGAIQSHLATKVLETGTQRVAFLLSTPKALVNVPQAQISVARRDGTVPPAQVVADYHEWPYGVRGSYSAPVAFPRPGEYVLTVDPIGGDVPGQAIIPVVALADAPIPSIGDTPPASATKTLAAGLELAELTTAYEPDAELYRLSVADALASGRPSVIVFATPAFCTSPTCGPQVDTVSELRAAHPDAANYIHIELYDNPQEIQGDLSRAQLVPAAAEWGFTQLPGWTNESWVFVLDRNGVIRHRFEGFATLAELTAALVDAGSP